MTINALLQPFQRFGVHLGLERIQQLLANLGNPHHRVPIIHVAGTNGKGSVCAYLSTILTEAGYRVGRYTSPHLMDWTERICLNQHPIALDELTQLLLQIKAAIPDDCDDSPTQFEVITAAAWLYFAQQQVDIAVIEVGLGGRLDATNVCDRPLATVITSISREHWQVLGPTLTDIAREKAGILKPNCPAIIGPLPPEAKAVVKARIHTLNCPAIWVEPAQIGTKNQEGFLGNQSVFSDTHSPYQWAHYQGIDYPLPLLGDIQLTNSAIAIATLQYLVKHGWSISEQTIIAGMAKTTWPGRVQWITWGDRRILVDGAHNPAAAKALRHYVDSLNTPLPRDHQSGNPEKIAPSGSIIWVMGMLSTKDHADIFQALLRPTDRLYLVPVPDHSSAAPDSLKAIAHQICPELADCQTCPTLETGLNAAISYSGDSQKNVIVLCGSLYLIGQVLPLCSEKR